MIPDYAADAMSMSLPEVFPRRLSRVRVYRSNQSSNEASSDESDVSIASRSDFGRSSLTDDVYEEGLVSNLSDLVYMPEDLVYHPDYHPDQIQVTHERMQQVLDELPGLSSDDSDGSGSPVPSHLALVQDYDIESEMSETPAVFEETDSDADLSHLLSAARREAEMDEECEDEYDEVPKPPELPVVHQEQLQDVWPLGVESFSIFTCPITHDVMTDPVVCADGYTYERVAIARWFETSRMSPVTGQTLPHTDMVPNHSVRTLLKTLIDMVGNATPPASQDANAAQTDRAKQQTPEATCCSAQGCTTGAQTYSPSAVSQQPQLDAEGTPRGDVRSPGQLSDAASALASTGELPAALPGDVHSDLAGRLRDIATQRRGRSTSEAEAPGSRSPVFGTSCPRLPAQGHHRRSLPGVISHHVAGELPHIDLVFSGPDRTTRRAPRSISSQVSTRIPHLPVEPLSSAIQAEVEIGAQSLRARCGSPWGIRFAGGPHSRVHRRQGFE
mmetsp:Transcript_19498/g.35364  ORF Transcript_19498/g.35364 Transcript_19498/m.35364 type:complete len:500 (+) Transcript_19498:106-1605(+)